MPHIRTVIINPPISSFATKTLRLKVKPNSVAWLRRASIEVNQVWNWANATSEKAVRKYVGKAHWLSGFDLCKLSAGAYAEFDHIGSHAIQRICTEYAAKRRAAKKVRLRWRVSSGAKRACGWVPFQSKDIKRKGAGLRFCGKSIRVFNRDLLDGVKWCDGCFSEDACGDWWLCLPVKVPVEIGCQFGDVGIDLGLKTTAVCSDGVVLEAGQFYRNSEAKIGQAQQRGHKRQSKRLHRRAKRRRRDVMHKFTTSVTQKYSAVYVGDVSSTKLVKTNMAKSVLDASWGMLRNQLEYKCHAAGLVYQVVNERNTTRACSGCGSLTGPTGRSGLSVRQWRCSACGAEHDRDVNSAINIRHVGARNRPLLAGTFMAVAA